MQAILIGSVQLSLLDSNSQQRFYLGLLSDCKHFFKDPKNMAEYETWQANKKAANENLNSPLATKN